MSPLFKTEELVVVFWQSTAQFVDVPIGDVSQCPVEAHVAVGWIINETADTVRLAQEMTCEKWANQLCIPTNCITGRRRLLPHGDEGSMRKVIESVLTLMRDEHGADIGTSSTLLRGPLQQAAELCREALETP